MKKLLIIFMLLMIIISMYQIGSMYALYREELESEYNTLLGVWSIKVNESDISSGEENLTFELTDEYIHFPTSEHTESGKFAPGSEFYVDLEFDARSTDVSVAYNVNLLEVTDLPQLKISRVENLFKVYGEEATTSNPDTTNNILDSLGKTYSGIIPLSKIAENNLNIVRIYFIWTNDDVSNETDTALGTTENKKITVPLEVIMKQYVAEEV